MNLSTLFLSTGKQMLQALSMQLAKAAAFVADGKIGEADLLETRLAPDMFPLSKQIAFACAQPLQGLARLRGDELSTMAEVATLADAQALITQVVAELDAADANQIDAAATRMIHMSLPNGMAFSLTGADYVRDWTLPQFYFHLMTSYSLLRHCGVAIGKADYVPHMARHAVPA